MVNWHIGCSGFYYDDWREFFYPEDMPKSRWFEYYTRHFDTLELNVTFYRFPKPETFEGWYRKSPDDFKFSVKAPRLVTHYKQFNDTATMMAGYYETIADGLKEKLGCILFQLPPRTTYSEEKLEKILDTIDTQYTNVLEFRHESWWNSAVINTLSKHKIIFCGMSHPKLPDDIIQNGPVMYYRYHGVPELYKSKYAFSEIKKMVDTVNANKTVKQAFIYFNNDIGASAIVNGKEMMEYAGKKLPDLPEVSYRKSVSRKRK